MLSYIIKRVLSLVPTLLIVPVVIFLTTYVIPGGPTIALLGIEAAPEAIADLNAQLGSDHPFFVQYTDRFMNMPHGDWGQSYFLQTTMLDAIEEYFVPTFSLAAFTQLISLITATPAGILATYRQGTSVSITTVSISLLGIVIPGFLLSMFLMLFLGVHLKRLPVAGCIQLSRGLLRHLRCPLLPALPLGTVQAAYIARMPRSAMLNTLYMDYIRAARIKRSGGSAVVPVYDLENVGPTILATAGQSFGSLITGTTVIETLFSMPGLDMFTMTSITRHGVFVIQGVVLLVTLIYVLIDLAMDILCEFVDPCIQLGDKWGGKS